MISIEEPSRRAYDPQQETAILRFKEKPQFDGEYWIRGGITWPEFSESTGRILPGYAVIVGCHVRTEIRCVFAEHEFTTIETNFNAEVQQAIPSLSPFLGHCWTQYFADTFFWRGREHIYRRYVEQIQNSQTIQPKPFFVDIGINDNDEPSIALWELMTAGKVKASKNGRLIGELQMLTAQPDEQLRAKEALSCAIYGMEKYRWQRRTD